MFATAFFELRYKVHYYIPKHNSLRGAKVFSEDGVRNTGMLRLLIATTSVATYVILKKYFSPAQGRLVAEKL